MTSVAPDRAAPPRGGLRLQGLDGLRAVAVAAVVVYHLGYEWLPGGFLGVDLFFVISGFLITTLLLTEVERHGGIRYGRFYLRRARRLLPALLLMLALTLALVVTVASDVARQTQRDVPAALLYVSNWWAIVSEQSYFELVGRGNMLAHLWSLAVEEQFYLVWPAVLGLVCLVAARTGVRRRHLVLVVAGGGALLSTAWMSTLALRSGAPVPNDPTRLYFGTDTHAMSVLVGAALAAVWQAARFRPDVVAGARRVLVGSGALGLAATAVLLLTVTEYTPWLYRGGFLVAALVFALVVAAATHPASPVGRVLDVAPMRWVGERSYGIYLYHWPILLVTRPGEDLPWSGAWLDVARVALVLAVAELSYRYVETPVRNGAIGAFLARRRDRARRLGGWAWVPHSRRAITLLACTAAALGLVQGLLSTAPTETQVAQAQGFGTVAEIVDDSVPTVAPGVAPVTASPTVTAAASPTSPTRGALASTDVSWYGTSVDLWAVDVLRAKVPGVRLDAGLNRSPGVILDHALRDQARGTLRRAVVLHLGDAGPISESRLESALAALDDRTRVVLVTSTARFAFVAANNRLLRQAAERHADVVVADWKAYSAGHTDWFKDGLHLTEKGKPVYALFIRRALLGV